MKKRRELDALIGNRSRRDTGGAGAEIHRGELDSLSSLSSPDAETYFAPSGTYMGVPSKRISHSGQGCGCTVRRMIRICLPACFLSLVAACITACIGIVWMQVQLKTDVEKLVNRLGKLEAWQQDQPLTLAQMKISISSMENDMQQVKDGENGIKNLASKVALLNTKVESIPGDDAIVQLKSETSDVKKVLDEVKASMANMKENIEGISTAQQMLTATYDKLNQDMKDLQKDSTDDQNVKQLSDLVSSSKQNTDMNIVQMNSTLIQISDRLDTLEKKVEKIEKISGDNVLQKIIPEITELKQDILTLKQNEASGNRTLVQLKNDLSNVQQKMSSDNTHSILPGANKPFIVNGEAGLTEDRSSRPTETAKEPSVVNGEAGIPQERSSRPTETTGSEGGINVKDKSDGGKEDSIYEAPGEHTESAQKQDIKPITQAVSRRNILALLPSRFDEIDQNKDGKLSVEELDSAFGAGVFSTLASFDQDHDNALSLNEVVLASKAQLPERHKRRTKSKLTPRKR